MALAGETIDAADINANNVYYAIKAGDESVVSSTALQNDDDLFADLTVGIWLVEAGLSVTGAAAGDVITDWSTTGTMTNLSLQISGPSSGMSSAINATLPRLQGNVALSNAPAFGVDGTNASFIYQRLMLDVDAPGRLQLRWAQATSSVTATVMKAGSHLVWRQLTAG